jgi:hypothetical protein
VVTQTFAPPVIQRAETEAAAGEAAAGGEGEAAMEEADIDIEALARQVLPEIKRRLAIERERRPARMG